MGESNLRAKIVQVLLELNIISDLSGIDPDVVSRLPREGVKIIPEVIPV